MKRYITLFFLGIIVSCYFFPIEFMFLPRGVNTKMMLAVIGGISIGFNILKTNELRCNKDVFGASVIAIIFSIVCFFSANYNQTGDYSYATYFFSFLTWITAAYAVCIFLRAYHKEVTFKLMTLYLTGVCTVQCILAIMIDRIPVFKSLVDSVVFQGQSFMDEIGRLYGIGAALDPAGTRFGIVLLMLSFLIFKDVEIQRKRNHVVLLILAFFIIAVIGNMIARTTSVGMMMGLIFMAYSMPVLKTYIKVRILKLWSLLFIVVAIAVMVVAYLYNNDVQTYNLLRFGFEGFFNWIETGVWYTSSTDKLNTVMWVWPEDIKSWIIGTGLFGHYIFSTDIGYCRFILYCGIVGFSVFAMLFVYGSFVFADKFPNYRLFCLGLCLLSFFIWIKVSTDLFLIHALLYCTDYVKKPYGNIAETNHNENAQ